MRRQLLTAVSLSVLMSAGVMAQESVDDERTSPIATSDADGAGNANDVVISSTGRVTLDTSGTAVTLDSDNSVTTENGSEITSEDADGDVGIELVAGNTGSLSHSGLITLSEEYNPEPSDGQELVFDTDNDGIPDAADDDRVDSDFDGVADSPDNEPDGPFAQAQNRTGILVSGSGNLIGDLVLDLTGSVAVEGQDSYGIRVAETAGIDGDIVIQGALSIQGENSRSVSLEGDVSGDFIFTGSSVLVAPDGNNIVISGDVGGGAFFDGSLETNGYRINTRQREAVYLILESGDDDLSAGSALVINGDLANGLYLLGDNVAASNSNINYSGSGPAILIRPDDLATTNQLIGEIVLPESLDATPDTTEDRTPGYGAAFEGLINARAIFDGQNAQGIVIEGNSSTGALVQTIIDGGLKLGGNITVESFDGTTTAVRIGNGAVIPVIDVDGFLFANSTLGFEADEFGDDQLGAGESYAIILEAGSDVQAINNSGSILSFLTGDGVAATAVVVNTDTLTELNNTGIINASLLNAVEGANDPILVAINASGMTSDLAITQSDADPDDDFTPSITGDILLGAGHDSLISTEGVIIGDVSMGSGMDIFSLTDTDFTGSLDDADGQLELTASNSAINLTGATELLLTNASFTDNSTLAVLVSAESEGLTNISATGNIYFDESSSLSVSLSGLVGESFTANIVEAGNLTFEDEANVFSFTETSYLYNATLARDEVDTNSVVLTLNRKTTEELGMNANQAAAFESSLDAIDSVDELGSAIVSIRTQSDFFQAYDQLLPEYAASAIQFALASNDAAQGALATRLHNARMAPDELAGLWAQELGYFTDRNNSPMAPGYRGEGIGLAVGFDRPIGPFYAVGFNLIGAASEIEEIDGNDEPMVAITGQLGAYAALDISGFDLSGSLGIGFDSFETERRILIGDFSSVNTADWTGWHATASAQLGRDLKAGNWIVRPELSLTYLSLFESGYSESSALTNNAALALVVDDRESSVLTGAATLALARRYGTDLSWWSPSLRVGYRGDFGDSNSETTAQFGETGNPFTLQSASLPGSGILVGLGLSAGSNYSTFSFGYDADIREDFIRHVARLMIRMSF